MDSGRLRHFACPTRSQPRGTGSRRRPLKACAVWPGGTNGWISSRNTHHYVAMACPTRAARVLSPLPGVNRDASAANPGGQAGHPWTSPGACGPPGTGSLAAPPGRARRTADHECSPWPEYAPRWRTNKPDAQSYGGSFGISASGSPIKKSKRFASSSTRT